MRNSSSDEILIGIEGTVWTPFKDVRTISLGTSRQKSTSRLLRKFSMPGNQETQKAFKHSFYFNSYLKFPQ
jgi:hypothetical protein